MAGRKRRIHFFEPVIIDSKDSVTNLDGSFWIGLHDKARELANHPEPAERNRLRREHLTFRYSGAARSESSPIADYFYIGKVRPGSDWPDMENSHAQTIPLELSDPEASLVEPAYLLPVSGTPFVAILRTSGGPSWSAIESWIQSVTGYDRNRERFELRPYVRKDQLERLHNSLGVSKLRLKVEPEASESIESESGQLADAIRSVLDLGAGGVSVDVGLSFGRSRPDEAAARKIAREVGKLLENAKFSRASATLLVEDEEGSGLQKETIDFYKDRVTLTEIVGSDENELPTASIVLQAMSQAVSNFKKSLVKWG